jgi:zinc and cadmium transporter
MDLFWMISALVAGSVGSVALAGLMLLLEDKKLEVVSTYLMYLAGGTLLGAAMLGMIPKAVIKLGPQPAMMTVLSGIMFFFVLEKVILWRSCHNKDCQRHQHAAVPIILIGDAFHNAIDGIVIAASFLSSPELGVFATVSVVLHEIPQELGDFGILIKSGMSKKKALLLNILSGSTSLVTGIAAWFMLDTMRGFIPYALAFSASSFLYIALADLIPEMHRKTSIKDSILQFALIITGIVLIYIILLSKH